jgi:hypothetical protein
MVASMSTLGLDRLESEDDIIAEANELTAHNRPRKAEVPAQVAPKAGPKRRRTA